MRAEEPPKPEEKPPQDTPPPPPAEAKETGKAPERKPVDERTVALLREAARRRRPWRPLTWVLAVVMFGGPAGLLAWWLWPRKEYPRLVVTAFDQVAIPGQPVVCRSRLELFDVNKVDLKTLDLSGLEITVEARWFGLRAGQKPALVKAKAQADGVATAEFTAPADLSRFDFSVLFVQPDRRAESTDQARVFAWPRQTRIVLVDMAALTDVGVNLWEQGPLTDAPLLPGAARVLQSARKSGFAVAYLAVVPERALRYRYLRSWLERRSTAVPQSGLPYGPLLGRLSVEPSADANRAVAALLQRFAGPHVVLVRQPDTGAAYRNAGLKTLAVGPGALAWEGVAKELPP